MIQFLYDILARLALLMDGRWEYISAPLHLARWRFSSGGQTLIIAGGMASLALAVLCYHRTREGLARGIRVALTLARFCGMLALLVMAAGTVGIINVTISRLPGLLVILDDSPSMALPVAANETRFSRAKRILWPGGLLNRLKSQYDVEITQTSGMKAAFDSETSPMPQDLAQGLIRQSTLHRTQPPAHILLISDGCELGYNHLAGAATELPAPVSTLCVGDETEIRDIILQDVSVPPFVYLHDRALISAQVKSLGIEQDVTLKLFEVTDTAEKEIGTTTIAIKPGNDSTTARVEFETHAAGLQHFSLRVLPVNGELTASNNSVDFNLEVRGDKIHVLFVEGEPGWEYRFAKQALEADPVIEFNGLVRLPGDEWFYQGRQKKPDGKAVIQKPKEGFPGTADELDYFDVLILGDLDRKVFEQSNRFDLLESFVKRKGGGLVTIGGFKVYTAGNYEDTPLGRMVPFNLMREKKLQLINRFNVQPTTQGIMHPAMQLELDPVKNEEAWSKLPWVEGGNAFKAVKPGATVMLRHPTLKTSLGPRPVTAAWQYGQGRVFSTALDGTWHWRLAHKTENDYHQRYWGQVARWAAGDPRMNKRTAAIICDKAIVEVASPVSFGLNLFDKDGNPDTDSSCRFIIEDPGATLTTGLSVSDPALPGNYSFSFIPARAGNHKVRAVITAQGDSSRTVETTVYAGPSRAEFIQAVPDPDALAKLAQATGGVNGSLARMDSFNLPAVHATAQVSQITVNLWQSPGLMIFLLACFSFEWLMRKRRGLA